MIRAKEYAVYDGIEYRARILPETVILFLPQTQPCPDGWGRSQGDRWSKRVPRASVEQLYSVDSAGKFHGILVRIHDVVPATETAWVYYVGGASDTPRDPAFTFDPDPGISEWTADVPWSSLTDVQEWVTPIPVVPPNVYI